MRVALYLRRSTNEELQADSLRSQEEQLRAFAAEAGHVIVATYSDSASGRQIEGRDEFQRLIAQVKRGAAFEAILVRDVSRWGRFANLDESAFYEFLCLTHGVQVIYVAESFGPDDAPFAAFQKVTKRWMAAEFSREKSRTVTRSQARVAKLGFVNGGTAPYGLRRILVDLSGAYVGELRFGDRKALSNMRVKLAPGDPAQVATVLSMFEQYGRGGASLNDIASALTAAGIAACRGGRWQPAMVGYMLRNESYIGTAHYTVRAGSRRSELWNQSDADNEGLFVRCARSFEGIIPLDLWEAVQTRLRSETWRKTDLDLANELRLAYERWGHVEARMLAAVENSAHWETYKNRFRRGYTEALEVAYADAVAAAKASLRTILEERFQVRDFESGWLIDDLLYVGFKFAWPRARLAGLFWPFAFTGQELEDVTIGFGFSPPPDVRAVTTLFFQTSHFKKREQTVYRSLSAKKSPHRFVETNGEDATRRYFQSAIYFRNQRAERKLLEAVKDIDLVNISHLARTLGWPTNTTRIIYLKLAARGAPVPPQKQKLGRRVEIVCPVCTQIRRLTPNDAMSVTDDRCFPCRNKRPRATTAIRCPSCGRVRELTPSQIRSLSLGRESLCHTCAIAKGRRIRKEWHAAQRPLELERRAFAFSLAPAILEAMVATGRYPNVTLWTRGRRAYPTFRWREGANDNRERLTVRCEVVPLVELRAEQRAAIVVAALAEESWTSIRPDGRNDAAWQTTIQFSREDVVAI
jgi:DNA invertase Pin-like site-specific DNA recombinase